MDHRFEPPIPEPAKDFFDATQAEHDRAEKALKENPALKDKALVMQYHSPAGEVINVVDVRHTAGSEALLLYGHDAEGNECQIVTPAQGVQLIMKVVPRTEQEPERKPTGLVWNRPDQAASRADNATPAP